ncbi:ABC transporter substrate-binding protein [Salipaludibacillus aurantiacus]|uniref:Putative spermidine/putrescine transport system substrate-binding protein n=1 Tax=Salipaludibacillus aurantiacus TaxID=1601833 RepID=A0A1H9X3U7_9BACI|nr:ABC transporter substrate-binding protein [Salipaludibacillus aurantiacus]SES40293.1 putative spermidine/putrescine transport system substrate-binding protein [Salipaludibacillus aurantiacus]
MKKVIPVIGLMASVLLACGQDQEKDAAHGLEGKDWDDIVSEAEGSEIGIYMWGGDDGVNQYLDEFVAPHLQQEYDITLTRYPMDAPDFLSKLMTEKEAGQNEGSADILWINGENFRNAKNNDLLYGEFTSHLPNMEDYIGGDAPFVHFDMGTEIDGHQAPWGNVQFAFQYNADRVENPPETMDDLIEWAIDNPGEFTYPSVNDFTGNAFVRHVMYHVADDPEELETFNEGWLEENKDEVFDTLRTFKESLWRNGQTYPESLSHLDQLYSNGEVAFTMGFNEHRAESLIEDGIFPEATETVVLEPGSISNTHYLSIPFNSPEPEAAMIAINFMLSPEAQIKKLDPSMWGEGTVLNAESISEEQVQEMEQITGPAIVESEDILPELDSRYHDWILEHWEREVVQQ